MRDTRSAWTSAAPRSPPAWSTRPGRSCAAPGAPTPPATPGRRRGRHRRVRRRAARGRTRSRPSASAPPASSTPTARRCCFAPNLSWRDEPLRDAVAERVGLPVVVENDANAAAWGEYRFGAGRGEDAPGAASPSGPASAAASSLDGALLPRAASASAREIGHMQMVARRPALRLRAARLLGAVLLAAARCCARPARSPASQREYGRRLLELGDGTPEGIEAREVTQAAREGDPAALECFADDRRLARPGDGRPRGGARPRAVRARRRRVATPATCCSSRRARRSARG